MKKVLLSMLMLGSIAFAVPVSEAFAATPVISGGPQIKIKIGPQRNRRRIHTTTTTRITRVGRFRYRETIRTTYLPNGRTRTQVVSRVRIFGRG
ncbi:MAG: hypothetical protein ABI878_06590 [Acidobacteriota bacterium]